MLFFHILWVNLNKKAGVNFNLRHVIQKKVKAKWLRLRLESLFNSRSLLVSPNPGYTVTLSIRSVPANSVNENN